MTGLFSANTGRDKFVAGWADNVKPPFSFPPRTPTPDSYWDPRKIQWATYTTVKNDIRDRGWPKVDISAAFVNAASVYDQIMDQYNTLPTHDHSVACWDPRRGQWMSVSAREIEEPVPSTGDRKKALEKVYQEIVDLNEKGYIRDAAFKTISDALLGER